MNPYQRIISEVHQKTGLFAELCDEYGEVCASADLSRIGQFDASVGGLPANGDQLAPRPDGTGWLCRVPDLQGQFLILSIKDISEDGYPYVLLLAKMIHAAALSSPIVDRSSFFRRILLGRLNALEIADLADGISIDCVRDRVVLIVSVRPGNAAPVVHVMKEVFSPEEDCVLQLSETQVAAIRTIAEQESETEIVQLAQAIAETLKGEYNIDICTAISPIKHALYDLEQGLSEARQALEVGRIASSDSVFVYSRLLLGRILARLDDVSLRKLAKEADFSLWDEQLDEEMLKTIDTFFGTSLNLSETARRLYVHRNTLVYRLDKVQRVTGFDLRNFTDALAYKLLAAMNQMLRYRENK